MKIEASLIDPVDTELPAKPPRRLTLARSLVGGLVTLTLVAGLILLVSLVAGRGAGPSGSNLGSQAITNTVVPVATAGPNPTPTPPSNVGGTVIPVISNPNASPTPPPYKPATPTVVSGVSPTPTPYDGKSPIPTTAVPGASPTPTPASGIPTSSTDPNSTITLGGTENVAVKYLQEWPIAFNQNALPPLVRATNPAVNYYGAFQDGSTVLAEVHAALVAAGYKYVSPDGSAATAPTWQPTGLSAFYTKLGQPDLYITLAALPTSEQVKQYLANGFDNGIISYEKVTEDLRTKGFKTVIMVTSAHNLLQVMRDGQDPGAGSPGGTPTPQK